MGVKTLTFVKYDYRRLELLGSKNMPKAVKGGCINHSVIQSISRVDDALRDCNRCVGGM